MPEDRKERLRELRAIAADLDAVRTLDGIRKAINYSENVHAPDAKFFLIEYDYKARRVNILPQAYLSKGIDQYESSENLDKLNAVLVEVDRLSDLKRAYPNYFLDVGMFVDRLRGIVETPKQSRRREWWESISQPLKRGR